MTHYKQAEIVGLGPERAEIILALLTDIGYEGFEELEDRLLAYIPASDFDQDTLDRALSGLDVQVAVHDIAPTNWNAEWERNFQPVVVDDFCTVRADFHTISIQTEYEVVITPKMSFGTGHHATTRLMILAMRELDIKGKRVFDFGSGTGILSVLAAKLGAAEVFAADIDEWCFHNALENVERNGVKQVHVLQGSFEQFPEGGCDILLANINRHILLEFMSSMAGNLRGSGTVVMSGLLVEDKEVILNAARTSGLNLRSERTLDNWISLVFTR